MCRTAAATLLHQRLVSAVPPLFCFLLPLAAESDGDSAPSRLETGHSARRPGGEPHNSSIGSEEDKKLNEKLFALG